MSDTTVHVVKKQPRETLQAWQVGREAPPRWIWAAILLGTLTIPRAHPGARLAIQVGPAQAYAGEWIVETARGTFNVYGDAAFRALYEVVQPDLSQEIDAALERDTKRMAMANMTDEDANALFDKANANAILAIKRAFARGWENSRTFYSMGKR